MENIVGIPNYAIKCNNLKNFTSIEVPTIVDGYPIVSNKAIGTQKTPNTAPVFFIRFMRFLIYYDFGYKNKKKYSRLSLRKIWGIVVIIIYWWVTNVQLGNKQHVIS